MEKKNRAQFIDLLKGLALLVMIEVHVFNSLLMPSIKAGAWFDLLTFINGLVAPAFTFTSGMVFVLSFQRGLDELRKFRMKFWKRLGRLILIFLAGYSIHMTFFSLRKISNPAYPHMLEEFLRVDILQCIAVGLILLLFIRIFIRSDKLFYITIALIDLFILVYGPFAWATDFTQIMPLSIANYFNRMHGSLFPLFPWLAFIFSGALLGKYYIDAKEKIGEKKFAQSIIIAGAILFFVSVLFLSYLFPSSLVSIKPNYFFFMERLGVLFVLLGIFWMYIDRFENYQSFVLDVSRESLLVYWLHLKLLYKKFWDDKSIVDLWSNSLNIFEALLVTIIIAAIMILTAKLWGFLKRRYPKTISNVVFGGVTIGVLIFFLY